MKYENSQSREPSIQHRSWRLFVLASRRTTGRKWQEQLKERRRHSFIVTTHETVFSAMDLAFRKTETWQPQIDLWAIGRQQTSGRHTANGSIFSEGDYSSLRCKLDVRPFPGRRLVGKGNFAPGLLGADTSRVLLLRHIQGKKADASF